MTHHCLLELDILGNEAHALTARHLQFVIQGKRLSPNGAGRGSEQTAGTSKLASHFPPSSFGWLDWADLGALQRVQLLTLSRTSSLLTMHRPPSPLRAGARSIGPAMWCLLKHQNSKVLRQHQEQTTILQRQQSHTSPILHPSS